METIKELDFKIKKHAAYILNIISWAFSIAIALGILYFISVIIMSILDLIGVFN